MVICGDDVRGDMRDTTASTFNKYAKYQNSRFCGLWKYAGDFDVHENVGCGVMRLQKGEWK
jgi:hypothetical protein